MQDDLSDIGPNTIVVGDAGRELILHQAGARRRLAAARLRRACRCAACQANRLRGTPDRATDDIRLAAVAAIGGYGLALAFSDGHARGVFPFAYLNELAVEALP